MISPQISLRCITSGKHQTYFSRHLSSSPLAYFRCCLRIFAVVARKTGEHPFLLFTGQPYLPWSHRIFVVSQSKSLWRATELSRAPTPSIFCSSQTTASSCRSKSEVPISPRPSLSIARMATHVLWPVLSLMRLLSLTTQKEDRGSHALATANDFGH